MEDKNNSTQYKKEYEEKLQERQKEIEIEKQQKNQLEKLLGKMQQKLVVGGKALEEKEKDRAKEVREMQLKLEKQRQKEVQLFEETKKKEEEMIMVERQYQDLQEEVVENRKIIKELRTRYKAALQEIEDSRKENQDGNEENLITIREQASEIDFYEKLVKNLLKPEEVQQVRVKSKHEENGWKIAPFVLKKHELNFPKLSRGKAKALVEEDLNQRDLSFNADNTTHLSTSTKHKKNASSKRAINIENNGMFSPKNGTIKMNNENGYGSLWNEKRTSRHETRHKKHISVQPPSVNMNKNYLGYSFEEGENNIPVKSVKKPNPTLAPISQKISNVPDLSNDGRGKIEAMIPSVDELRKRRGDLMPLNHNMHNKRNNSYDSQDN